jgi:uncharacterized membrane protein YqjE
VRERLFLGLVFVVATLIWVGLPIFAVAFVWEPVFGDFFREHATIFQTLVVVGAVWVLLKSYNDDLVARIDKLDRRLALLEGSANG